MKKIYIAGVDCSISEAIKFALAGDKILVPESKNGKPSIDNPFLNSCFCKNRGDYNHK